MHRYLVKNLFHTVIVTAIRDALGGVLEISSGDVVELKPEEVPIVLKVAGPNTLEPVTEPALLDEPIEEDKPEPKKESRRSRR